MDPKDLEALIQERFNDEFSLPEGVTPSSELYHLLSHASCRDYADKPISPSLLQFLCYCALSSPSKSDLQQVDIIHLKNPEKRHQLEALVPSMPWIKDASEFLVFCGNNRRIREVCQLRGKPFANDHVDSVVNSAVDAGIVMSTFIRAAEALGLACCPISVIRNRVFEVSEVLELPDYVFPLAGLTVGSPKTEAHISPRLPVTLTLHTDTFEEKPLAEYLSPYDAYRQSRKEFESQRYAEEYGNIEDYSWSEDKARQYSKSERADFGKYLIHQGFRLV